MPPYLDSQIFCCWWTSEWAAWLKAHTTVLLPEKSNPGNVVGFKHISMLFKTCKNKRQYFFEKGSVKLTTAFILHSHVRIYLYIYMDNLSSTSLKRSTSLLSVRYSKYSEADKKHCMPLTDMLIYSQENREVWAIFQSKYRLKMIFTLCIILIWSISTFLLLS